MRILIDLDSIAADLNAKWLPAYNAKHLQNITVDDLHDYDMRAVEPNHRADLFDMLKVPGFYKDLPIIDGAYEAIRELRRNHEVRLISAPMSTHGFSEKAEWVEEYLQVDHRCLMIMPGSDKHWVQADVIIDDKPKTLLAFKAAQPRIKAITIGYPYNRFVRDSIDLWAEDYRDTKAAWKQIVDYLRLLQEVGHRIRH